MYYEKLTKIFPRSSVYEESDIEISTTVKVSVEDTSDQEESNENTHSGEAVNFVFEKDALTQSVATEDHEENRVDETRQFDRFS